MCIRSKLENIFLYEFKGPLVKGTYSINNTVDRVTGISATEIDTHNVGKVCESI